MGEDMPWYAIRFSAKKRLAPQQQLQLRNPGQDFQDHVQTAWQSALATNLIHWKPLENPRRSQEPTKPVQFTAHNPPTPADSRGSASEKQLHAASRTRSKCQSADAKAKMFSKSKQGKGESNQAARAGSKQARRRRGSNYTHQVVHAANVKVPMQKDFLASFKKGQGQSNQAARARSK